MYDRDFNVGARATRAAWQQEVPGLAVPCIAPCCREAWCALPKSAYLSMDRCRRPWLDRCQRVPTPVDAELKAFIEWLPVKEFKQRTGESDLNRDIHP